MGKHRSRQQGGYRGQQDKQDKRQPNQNQKKTGTLVIPSAGPPPSTSQPGKSTKKQYKDHYYDSWFSSKATPREIDAVAQEVFGGLYYRNGTTPTK